MPLSLSLIAADAAADAMPHLLIFAIVFFADAAAAMPLRHAIFALILPLRHARRHASAIATPLRKLLFHFHYAADAAPPVFYADVSLRCRHTPLPCSCRVMLFAYVISPPRFRLFRRAGFSAARCYYVAAA